jgi:putative FmdB family regulatory protein
MPLYDYKCVQCEHVETEFRPMHARNENGKCPECEAATERQFDFGADRGMTREFAKPIEMLSIALNSDAEITAFRQRNPDVDISTNRNDPAYGVPIARTRQQKLAILDREGFQELN